MYDFILQIVVFASLGVLIYLFARGVARISDPETPAVIEPRHGVFDRFLKSLPLQKIDAFLSGMFERVLRRARVILMKFDNLLNRSISRVKKGDKNNNDSLPPINQP